MEWFDDKRIKQYAIALLSMTLIMLILMGIFSYNNTKSVQLDNFYELSLNFTKLVEKNISDEILSYRAYGDMLSNSKEVRDYVKSPRTLGYEFRVENLIDLTRKDFDNYVSVSINLYASSNDNIYICKIGEEIKNKVIEKEYFRNHAYYVGLFKPYQNKILVQVTVPIYIDDEVVGNVCLQLDIKPFLEDYIENISYQDSGYLYFISRENEFLITSSEVSDYVSVINVFHELLDQNIENEIILSETDSRYYYLRPYNFLDEDVSYYLVFSQTVEELFAFSRAIIINTVLVTILFSLIFIILTRITGRKFIRLTMEDTKTAIEVTLDTEVKRQTKELKKIAETDSLTKLYNHGAFYEALAQAIESSKQDQIPLCLMMLDLDHFKEVNDNYGHPVGDEVLVVLAGLLEENIRDRDIAGRYGGEEFAILLRDIHLDKCYSIAERIRKTVLSTEFTENSIKLTISIGIAEWDHEDVASFVKRTDKKLYSSKSYGRNKTTF